ncbi:MAG: HNH endonuclease [Patescibacteria group bacterium]
MAQTNSCLWCDSDTTNSVGQEHIIPESIGGVMKLPKGIVCDECNNYFGNELDMHLRTGHPLMMLAYQRDPQIKGKRKGGKGVKSRREKSKEYLVNEQGMVCAKTGDNGYTLNSAIPLTYSDLFVRSLHKCLINAVVAELGPEIAKEELSKVIQFVKTGESPFSWSYAVSFLGPFPLVFFRANYILVKIDDIYFLALIHTSGIWVVSSEPNAIHPANIDYLSKKLSEKFLELDWKLSGNLTNKEVISNFGWDFADNRKQFGTLGFYWATKDLPPSNCLLGKNKARLLTECKTCGQTNPVPLPFCIFDFSELAKNKKTYQFVSNKWNCYDHSTLKAIDFDKQHNHEIKKIIKQGMRVFFNCSDLGIEIRDCNFSCVKCKNEILFSSKDCFV